MNNDILRITNKYPELVDEILNQIPESIWKSNKTTFFDPEIGGGQIVYKIERKLLTYGHSYDNIKKRVYGYGLWSKGAVNRYNLHGTYCNKNILEENIKMKFDVIIGNPPYQKTKPDGSRYDTGSNLWSTFWSKSIKTWSHDNSKIVLITPTTWLAPSADLKGDYKINGHNRLWDIFNSYTSYADVKNVSKYFNIGSTFGYVYVDKSGKEGLHFSDGATTKLGFLPNSNIEYVLQKIDTNKNLGKYFTIQQTRDPENRLCVLVPVTKSLKPDSIKILESPGHNEQQDFYVYVNNKKEAKKVQKTIVDALDLLKTHCRWSGFLNIKVVKLLKYVE